MELEFIKMIPKEDSTMEFDKKNYSQLTRRDILKSSLVLAGAAVAGSIPFCEAFAAAFPDRNIKVYIPTSEGGGADRLLRAISGVWTNYLGVNFEPSFYPGASGRVGYEKFMGLAKADMYELLFGNMGAEVLNWVVKKPTYDLDTFKYIAQVDSDPGVVYVSSRSPFQTIDELVAEGKKKEAEFWRQQIGPSSNLRCIGARQTHGCRIQSGSIFGR